MKYCLLLIFCPLFVFSQISKQVNKPKALELNNKAFKLLLVTSNRDTKENIRILKILDSATNIDPKLNSAISNKVKPLLSLKRYSLALETIKKAIKNSPNDANLLIREGVIYECYFAKKSQAALSYQKAYNILLQKKQKTSNSSSFNDQELAYVLMFCKGKDAALAYLEKISTNYKDQKNLKQISQLKQFISSKPFDCESKKEVFNSFIS